MNMRNFFVVACLHLSSPRRVNNTGMLRESRAQKERPLRQDLVCAILTVGGEPGVFSLLLLDSKSKTFNGPS